MRKSLLIACTLLVLLPFEITAQDAVPAGILQRTILIKNGNESGTAFTVDYEGKMYLVTARHLTKGLPPKNAVIQIWQQGQWKNYDTVKTIFPSSSQIDIAVFETTEKVQKPYLVSVMGGLAGPTMGQQVWFLGYPFATFYSRFQNGGTAPFIKRGTMSAVDGPVIYLDGFNNPGFSGGPVIYWDFSSHTYKIAAVVSGYREDTAKVVVNGKQVSAPILVNSGIVICYNVKYAMDAIKESQNGSVTVTR